MFFCYSRNPMPFVQWFCDGDAFQECGFPSPQFAHAVLCNGWPQRGQISWFCRCDLSASRTASGISSSNGASHCTGSVTFSPSDDKWSFS